MAPFSDVRKFGWAVELVKAFDTDGQWLYATNAMSDLIGQDILVILILFAFAYVVNLPCHLFSEGGGHACLYDTFSISKTEKTKN